MSEKDSPQEQFRKKDGMRRLGLPDTDKFRDVIRSILEDTHEGEEQDPIYKLANIISHLSYTDYRILEGMLQDARSSGENNFTALKGALNLSDDLHDILDGLKKFAGRNPEGAGEFATDALLLARISYPFGKNIVNTTQDPALGPVALKGNEKATVICGDTEIEISPGRHQSLICLKNGSVKQCGGLENGESMVVGRPLEVHTFFGEKLKKTVHVPIRVIVEDEMVSRGGIMIARTKKGEIYVFDRGSRNPVLCRQKELEVTYNPTAEGTDGIGYGASTMRTIR